MKILKTAKYIEASNIKPRLSDDYYGHPDYKKPIEDDKGNFSCPDCGSYDIYEIGEHGWGCKSCGSENI